MKKFLVLPAAAKSVFSLMKTGVLILFLTQLSFSQIVIEERVEINPESTNNILPLGSISGDDRNPAYIRYGGNISVRSINWRPGTNYQLWEESLGYITSPTPSGFSTNIGEFPQWHKFVFYLHNTATNQNYYPLSEVIGGIQWDTGWLEFHPSYVPGDPIPYKPDFIWSIEIEPNYSLAQMPPPEILSYIFNPFQPGEEFVVQYPGNLYAIVEKAVTPQDEFWIDKPNTQMIVDELGSHIDDSLFLGHINAGDTSRFFIRSPNTIVNGMNIYPWLLFFEEVRPGGEIFMYRLIFEDWTDLYFDDVTIDIFFLPDSGVYPGPLEVTIQPAELAPGDTASITFKRRYLDGTVEDFPEWQTFEIGMVDGCTLGNFLVNGELEPYFYDVAQPVYFVVDPSANTGTVKLQVALVEEGIGTRPIKNNLTNDTYKQINTENPNLTRNLNEVISARRENRTEPVDENKKIYENVSPNNPENLTCPILNFNNLILTPFEIPIKDEVIEIMLGETKYFQAKRNTSTGELKIEEIEPVANGVPQQKTGTENGWEWVTEDKWGTDPILPIIENSVSAVYWEKRYPIYDEINDYDGSEDLDDGLIRVMGRFWREKESSENEIEYKNKHSVKLIVKFSNDVTKSIVLKVIKPNKLGTVHNQEKDVFGNFYNLDEEIFYYAGKYGIPPQFIKADIEAEGNFNPAYRYEPFYTIKMLYKVNEKGKFGLVHDLLISSPYRITVDGKIYLDASNINGTANIGPVDGLEAHVYITNGVVINGIPVTINGYPGYTGSIWDDFYANCETVNPDALLDIYPKDEPQWSEDAIKGWDEKYDEFYSNWEKKIGTNITIGAVTVEITEELIKILARLYANEWLKTEYRGGIFQTGIAQTRLAASYGVMQIIYPSAKSFQYYTGKPELLNEYDINFSNAIPFLKKKVRLTLNLTETDFNKKNNFSLGIEEVYVSGFNKYHNSEKVEYCGNKYTYGRCVLSKNKKYNPIK